MVNKLKNLSAKDINWDIFKHKSLIYKNLIHHHKEFITYRLERGYSLRSIFQEFNKHITKRGYKIIFASFRLTLKRDFSNYYKGKVINRNLEGIICENYKQYLFSLKDRLKTGLETKSTIYNEFHNYLIKEGYKIDIRKMRGVINYFSTNYYQKGSIANSESVNTNSSKQLNKEESIVKSEENNTNSSKQLNKEESINKDQENKSEEKEEMDLNNLSLPQIARLPIEQKKEARRLRAKRLIEEIKNDPKYQHPKRPDY